MHKQRRLPSWPKSLSLAFAPQKHVAELYFPFLVNLLFFAYLGEENKADIALMVLLNMPSAAARFASSICASSKDVLA